MRSIGNKNRTTFNHDYYWHRQYEPSIKLHFKVRTQGMREKRWRSLRETKVEGERAQAISNTKTQLLRKLQRSHSSVVNAFLLNGSLMHNNKTRRAKRKSHIHTEISEYRIARSDEIGGKQNINREWCKGKSASVCNKNE